MTQTRVMMIGLDGFELSIAERLMAEGRLPTFSRLRREGAQLLLDHGAAKRTGLAWEHVSSGQEPDRARRWGAVRFDRERYRVEQSPAQTRPFPSYLDRRCVVFDVPYFDLDRAPEVRGLGFWGAHDPGVAPRARPDSLVQEAAARFGVYPAKKWIYGFAWPYAERAREMADALRRAVETRFEIAEWLFGERLADWDLAMFVLSEFHSSIEALWHGIDDSHPLHGLPSAAAARDGIEGVYEATDRGLGRLVERFPDVQFALFASHGMGANDADVASMALLPELLYRHNFGKPAMRPSDWPLTPSGTPVIVSGRGWETELNRVLPRSLHFRPRRDRLVGAMRALLPGSAREGVTPLGWMPAARYRGFWPEMRAFALPSFYDGQIRVNLKGRESRGMVEPEDYERVRDELEALVRECRNSVTGEPVVADIERFGSPGRAISESQADMLVLWRGNPLGLVHPKLGTIGPLPHRRTGGHTGESGVAWLHGSAVRAGRYGTRSSFDVVPTIVEMLGAPPVAQISGASFYREIAARRGGRRGRQQVPVLEAAQ